MNKLVIALTLVLLSSCATKEQMDSAPRENVDVSNIPDAVPKVEKITKAGNKSPYTVLGKTYRVMASSNGYRERGIASWYGTKFHGQNTSNGEVYSMYKMTAAHKSLPIPSYVKVTNLNNGVSAIVRINDRGPFHGGRIIDLSYAAAKKLGYADIGTAPVEVVAIDPINYQKNSVQEPAIATADPVPEKAYQLPFNTFLQAGAFQSRESAQALADRLQRITNYPITIKAKDDTSGFYKVLLGPLKNNLEVKDLRQLLAQTQNINALVVYH